MPFSYVIPTSSCLVFHLKKGFYADLDYRITLTSSTAGIKVNDKFTSIFSGCVKLVVVANTLCSFSLICVLISQDMSENKISHQFLTVKFSNRHGSPRSHKNYARPGPGSLATLVYCIRFLNKASCYIEQEKERKNEIYNEMFEFALQQSISNGAFTNKACSFKMLKHFSSKRNLLRFLDSLFCQLFKNLSIIH